MSSKYWNGFLASGLAYAKVAEIADSELPRMVEKPKKVGKSFKCREMARWFLHIVMELKRKGVTLQRLWQE